MTNNSKQRAFRHVSCGIAFERLTDTLSAYKVSKQGNESLLNIQQGNESLSKKSIFV